MKYIFTIIVLLLFFVPSQSTNAEDDLFDMSLQELMSVDVYAASKTLEPLSSAPGSVTVINAHMIEAFGMTTLSEVMALVPGATPLKSSSYRSSIAIRGTQFTGRDQHVLVLINGFPVREVFIGGLNMALYTYVPLEQLERVEVVKGPGSVLYGSSAVAGVINLVSKQAKSSDFTINAGALAGTQDEYRVYAGVTGLVHETPLSVYGSLYQEPLWQGEFVLEDSTTSQLTFPRQGGAAGIELHAGSVNFQTHLVFDEFKSFNTRLVTPLNTMHLVQMMNELSWQTAVGEEWEVAVSAGHTLFSWGGSEPARDGYSSEALVEPTVSWHIERLQAILGVTAALRSGNALEGVFDPEIADTVIPNFHAYEITGFGQLKWDAFNNLQFVLGMQAGKVQEVAAGLHPRIGVNYGLSEEWMAKLYYGSAYRVPYALEFETDHPLIQGNKNLENERVETIDAEVSYSTEKLQIQGRWFHSSYDNIIRLDASEIPLQYVNKDLIECHGFELESHWAPSSEVFVVAGGTYLDFHLDESMLVEQIASEFEGFVGVAWHVNTWLQLGGLYQFRSKPISYSPNEIETTLGAPVIEDIHGLDVNANIANLDWLSGFQLYLKATNLLGQEFRQGEANRPVVTSFPVRNETCVHIGVRYIFVGD